ncbi:uncharacterized protein [Sylvia atricapilla]|uniref:uncharacterized protein n=1 Tax=Sylvia atricapilla TaxID=48155 RepID=UPI00339419EA
MLWETKGNRRNTFCLHTHMFIIPNFHFAQRVCVGSCVWSNHHKRGIFLPDFAAFKAKRGGERTSGSAAARALPVAESGHRRAEEEMPGEPGAPHLSLIAAERARERKLPQTRQQNAVFRRLRASFLHTTIINLRTEIKDPRAKEIIDSARKRFIGAAHGQSPPTAGTVLFYSPTTLHGGPPKVPVLLPSIKFPEHTRWPNTFPRQQCSSPSIFNKTEADYKG